MQFSFRISISDIYSATLAIVGRFWVNISYNIGLQYAAEVLPTVVRAQGVALIHIMGYVASILAPFVVYLDTVSSILPLLVLGVIGVLGGLLTLLLPETLDKDLPQTLQDGEDFGKDQKIWDMPCLSKYVSKMILSHYFAKLLRYPIHSFFNKIITSFVQIFTLFKVKFLLFWNKIPEGNFWDVISKMEPHSKKEIEISLLRSKSHSKRINSF